MEKKIDTSFYSKEEMFFSFAYDIFWFFHPKHVRDDGEVGMHKMVSLWRRKKTPKASLIWMWVTEEEGANFKKKFEEEDLIL